MLAEEGWQGLCSHTGVPLTFLWEETELCSQLPSRAGWMESARPGRHDVLWQSSPEMSHEWSKLSGCRAWRTSAGGGVSRSLGRLSLCHH